MGFRVRSRKEGLGQENWCSLTAHPLNIPEQDPARAVAAHGWLPFWPHGTDWGSTQVRVADELLQPLPLR